MSLRAEVRDWIGKGDTLFADVFPLHSLWQTLCENFHVMRADYTRKRFFSEEFASYLMTGRPAMAHRDLSNALPAMMRPSDRRWLNIRTHDDAINGDREARAFLDHISDLQYRAMYAPHANMLRACKEADGDFVSVGNAVLTVEPNLMRNGLLINCHHPRDVVWAEGADHKIREVHFRRQLSIRDLCGMFPRTAADTVKTAKEKEPNKKVNVRRFIAPIDEYQAEKPLRNKARFSCWSVYVDIDNDTILEEVPQRVPLAGTVIPRWVTISTSQYAYSPAAIYGLPDARMLQQMALTILEAGQKATDPPLKAVAEAISGGVNTGAGMITWVDPDYDERTGPALEHLIQKYDGLEYGAAREEKVEGTLDAIFFLNQIRMPQITKDMTAYEASKLYEEFQRNSLPLLEPVAVEYNGGICEAAYEQMMDMSLFGPKDANGGLIGLPRILARQDIRFDFDTPLKAAAEQAKIFKFSQVTDILAKGMQVDQTVVMDVDVHKGTRDAITAAGGAEWLVPEDVAKKNIATQQRQAQAASAAAAVAHGADTATRVAGAAKSAGDAAQAMQQAGIGG